VLTSFGKTGNFTLGTIGLDPAGRSLSAFGDVTLQQTSTSVVLTFTPTFSPLVAWRFQQFGVYADTPELLAGDTEDADGDGLANLLEYAFDTDPGTANPAPLSITRSGNFLVLTYVRRSPADPALAYAVQASGDLATGFTTGTGSTQTTGTTSVYTDDVDLSVVPGRRFLRVSVTYTAP
jgi:hypothetical protein